MSARPARSAGACTRSEEHTSELYSLTKQEDLPSYIQAGLRAVDLPHQPAQDFSRPNFNECLHALRDQQAHALDRKSTRLNSIHLPNKKIYRATFRQVFERSICRISPHRTFPGPTSMNVCTPCAISRRMHWSHLTDRQSVV